MPQLPTIPFGPTQVTRLISGGNPLVGNSHYTPEWNRDMRDYFTTEEVVKYMHRCQAAGINTLQARGDYRVLQWIEFFKREGGKLNFIVQTASEMHDVFENIRVIAATKPLGIYHHGTLTDRWWVEGKIDRVKDYLACMRDCGVQVGLGTHFPEVVEYVEEKGWDLDFYMTCVYNLNRVPREGMAHKGGFTPEHFAEEDPPRMYETIRAAKKTCLAFKIMAAGRRAKTQETVRAAFGEAFANIKPTDAVVVGMFDKYLTDQIARNVRYTIEACAPTG